MTADATSKDDLPNLPLLIKLLKMTTSSNDGEALMAVRKANEQLKKFGGDWESLLRGKVTMITNPFAGNPTGPDQSQVRRSSGPPPHPGRPPPQPTPQPQPTSAWQQAHRPRPQPQPQPKPRPQAAKTTAAKPQPAPKKAPSFSNVDRVQLDDIV